MSVLKDAALASDLRWHGLKSTGYAGDPGAKWAVGQRETVRGASLVPDVKPQGVSRCSGLRELLPPHVAERRLEGTDWYVPYGGRSTFCYLSLHPRAGTGLYSTDMHASMAETVKQALIIR